MCLTYENTSNGIRTKYIITADNENVYIKSVILTYS